MTTPHARDYRLSNTEYGLYPSEAADLGTIGQGRKVVVPYRSRCKSCFININTNVSAINVCEAKINGSTLSPPMQHSTPANTGPSGDGDIFEYANFEKDGDYFGTDQIFHQGDLISLQTDGGGASNSCPHAFVMSADEPMPLGESVFQFGEITDQSVGGDFDIAVVSDKNMVIKHLLVNADNGTDLLDTYTLKVNGSVVASVGRGTAGLVSGEGELVPMPRFEIAKGDLIEVSHSGTSTGVGNVYCAGVFESGGNIGDVTTSAGKVADLTTATDYDIGVVIAESMTIRGIMFHTEVTTDAADSLRLKVNGANLGSYRFNVTNGLLANSGEFVGISKRYEAVPGDLIEINNIGTSTGGAPAHVSIVFGK
jgi:hypothetical protein